jgi:hypothetical protein
MALPYVAFIVVEAVTVIELEVGALVKVNKQPGTLVVTLDR